MLFDQRMREGPLAAPELETILLERLPARPGRSQLLPLVNERANHLRQLLDAGPGKSAAEDRMFGKGRVGDSTDTGAAPTVMAKPAPKSDDRHHGRKMR
jgi:hypothetical protein